MRRKLISSILMVALCLAPVSSAYALTREDIINMSNIGVADSVIISAIKSSDAVFKLTAQEIIELTKAGVSQSVIEAMQATAAGAPAPATPAPSTPAPSRATPAPTPSSSQPAEDEEEEEEAAPTPKPTAPAPRTTQPPRATPEKSVESESGSGKSRSSGNKDKPLPADVKQLKRKYDGGKYASAALTAYDLLSGPNKDDYADAEDTIHYYLARSLEKLGYIQSAHNFYLEVAEVGPEGLHYNGSLSNLSRTSVVLKDYDDFKQILEGASSKDLPRRVKNTLLYLKGLSHFENEDFDDARQALDGVAATSEFYAQAQFLEAMARYRQGDSAGAVKTFRALVEASQLIGDPGTIRDVKDLSLLNMARVYYRVEDYAKAVTLYGLVPRDSDYWPQALYESAYASFFQNDYNVSLGELLTIRSPFFAGKVFIPDADILQALVYFNLCEYDRVQSIISRFQSTWKPVRDRIRTFTRAYESVVKLDDAQFEKNADARKQALAAYDALFGESGKDPGLDLPPEVVKELEQQRELEGILHHLNLLRQELTELKNPKGRWKGTKLGSSLAQSLEREERQLRATAGRFMLKQLERIERELSGQLGQSDIIQFEVVNAQKEAFEDRFRNPEYVETYEKLEASYATESTYIFWPFTGEFWEDELGYYRYTERGSCSAKGK